MARKIGILEVRQNSKDKPASYVKKSVACLLVRRSLAEWVIENFLCRMRPAREMCSALPYSTRRAPRYIPDRLPPNIDSMLGIIVVGIPRKLLNPEQIRP